jgi:RNA polymerase sigma-B factor
MAINSSPAAPAAEPKRALPVPSGQIRQNLSELDDRELLALAGSLPRSSERRAAARDLLVSRHRALVQSCVRQYSHVPESAEDLTQVGYVGLLKAINNFDPAFGCSLTSYAMPYIVGEIKRHFRDKRWQVHVERPLQELVLHVREATGRLTQQLGHTPTDAELASDLGVRDADIRDARQAELVLQPRSLDEPAGPQASTLRLADLLGEEDPRLEHKLGMRAIATHWGELPAREQKILILSFFGGMTQTQIGQQLGLSQMQVSRLLARALGYLRPLLTGMPAAPVRPGPAAVATGNGSVTPQFRR